MDIHWRSVYFDLNFLQREGMGTFHSIQVMVLPYLLLCFPFFSLFFLSFTIFLLKIKYPRLNNFFPLWINYSNRTSIYQATATLNTMKCWMISPKRRCASKWVGHFLSRHQHWASKLYSVQFIANLLYLVLFLIFKKAKVNNVFEWVDKKLDEKEVEIWPINFWASGNTMSYQKKIGKNMIVR